MPPARQARAEPIPGYRLLEPLGKGGFGEVWKCEAPGGLFKAIKFVHGAGNALDAGGPGAEQELKALEHIRSIRHPFLLSMDRIEFVEGELVIVMELADQSLHDYYQQCRNAGLPGIPRPDLLGALQEAAEALDLINIRHGLQHLDIKPRNLLLVSLHVKVADFGLVSRLAEATAATRKQLAAISPIYASPEVFQGTFSPASDQYSLAVAYQQLLSGEPPFKGKNFRQLAVQHMQAEPDLQALPEADRGTVARALSKDPAKRFPSCSDFLHALLTAGPAAAPVAPSARLRWQAEPPAAAPGADAGASNGRPPSATELPGFTEGVEEAPTAGLPGSPRGLPASPTALSDYQFQNCLERGEIAELWQAHAPAVGPCFVRFLYRLGAFGGPARGEALQRLTALSHPAAVPTALVRNDPARVVLMTPRLGGTLRERCQQAQADGLRGVPRAELLACLRDAAGTLEILHRQHGLPHLALSPDNLQLAQGRTLAADYGLAPLFWLPAGLPIAAGNPRYAAPELWGNALGPACDSYSMAVIYQEMLTGCHPFAASPRADAARRVLTRPDLSPLPEGDRAVLRRALECTPSQRFASCSDLLDALERVAPDQAALAPARPPAAGQEPNPGDGTTAPLSRLLQEVLACAAGDSVALEHNAFHYLLQPGRSIRHRFIARVVPRALPVILSGFARQWHADVLEQNEERLAYRVALPGEGWHGSGGRPAGLELELRFRSRSTLPPPLAEVRVLLKPFGCSALAADQLLRQSGPWLLDGLRQALQAHPERRVQERLAYDEPVTVWPVGDDGLEQMPLRAQGKDLSRGGVGFYLAQEPPTERIRLFLSVGGRTCAVPVPARVVRVEPRAGRFEVGAAFAFEAEPAPL